MTDWECKIKQIVNKVGFPFFSFYAMSKQVLILRVLYTVIAFTEDKVFILILKVRNGLWWTFLVGFLQMSSLKNWTDVHAHFNHGSSLFGCEPSLLFSPECYYDDKITKSWNRLKVNPTGFFSLCKKDHWTWDGSLYKRTDLWLGSPGLMLTSR